MHRRVGRQPHRSCLRRRPHRVHQPAWSPRGLRRGLRRPLTRPGPNLSVGGPLYRLTVATKTDAYQCTECGWTTVRWPGRWTAPDLGSAAERGAQLQLINARCPPEGRCRSARSTPERESDADRHRGFGSVLGGGLVPGAVVLLAGEPRASRRCCWRLRSRRGLQPGPPRGLGWRVRCEVLAPGGTHWSGGRPALPGLPRPTWARYWATSNRPTRACWWSTRSKPSAPPKPTARRVGSARSARSPWRWCGQQAARCRLVGYVTKDGLIAPARRWSTSSTWCSPSKATGTPAFGWCGPPRTGSGPRTRSAASKWPRVGSSRCLIRPDLFTSHAGTAASAPA